MDIVLDRGIRLSENLWTWEFARSGGPGGQNVNKVASKATLRWPIVTSEALPPDVKERFLKAYATRITQEGELLIVSQRYRDQPRNQQDCVEKLTAMITAVLVPPKKRRPTKPTAGSERRRLEAKKRNASRKESRRVSGE